MTKIEIRPERSCGEVLAEACQGFRNRITRGEMPPEEALERCEKARRELMVLAEIGKLPFETGSTQLKALQGEWERLGGFSRRQPGAEA